MNPTTRKWSIVFGNVVSDAEILELRRSKDIVIDPFHQNRMRLAHYALTAGAVIRLQNQADIHGTRELHDFDVRPTYAFQPNEYQLVEVVEQITLAPGFVGSFVAASDLIEHGFGLTAGKIDPGFGSLGNRKQKVRFGIKNLLDEENVFDRNMGLAHVYFVNLRGLRTRRTRQFTQEEQSKLERRHDLRYLRDYDDGVPYPDDDEY